MTIEFVVPKTVVVTTEPVVTKIVTVTPAGLLCVVAGSGAGLVGLGELFSGAVELGALGVLLCVICDVEAISDWVAGRVVTSGDAVSAGGITGSPASV